ncbi:MAG: translation initiation factor IF-2, partial [Nanoarchaeota archaeon]|nr:translation initiation factor IF-2 [Nanoarchaeota archaeon]
LSDSIFRRSSPFIAGVEILAGELRPNYYVIDENAKRIGKVLGIQSEKKALASIRTGEKAAISIEGAVFGRNVRANQILYSDMSNEDMIKFIDISSTLPEDYQEAFQEIRKIKGF